MGFTTQAQNIPGINYQALVRDINGQAIASQNIQIRVSILQDSTTGTVVYKESHNVATNSFGQLNLSIGEGEVLQGTFNAINWGSAPFFLKTEIDLNYSGTFHELEVVKFYSVPYSQCSDISKGIPSMSYAERDAIENPWPGMQIFNTTTNCLNFYTGTTWLETCGNEITCGEPFTDSRDGQQYNTVKIGSQCWMAENLAYLPEASPSSEGSDTDPYYYVYDYQGTNIAEANSTNNYQNYRTLYNWSASLTVCPDGWHLPTNAEWIVLTGYLDGESVAGGKMKSTRTEPDPHPRWNSPNTGATNSSGFSGLPGGYRNPDDSFNRLGIYGYFWSSTESSTTDAVRLVMDYSGVYANRGGTTKGCGFLVRCLRD